MISASINLHNFDQPYGYLNDSSNLVQPTVSNYFLPSKKNGETKGVLFKKIGLSSQIITSQNLRLVYCFDNGRNGALVKFLSRGPFKQRVIRPCRIDFKGSQLGTPKTGDPTVLEITEYNDQLVKNTRNEL